MNIQPPHLCQLYNYSNYTALLLPHDSDVPSCIYDPTFKEKTLKLVLLYLQVEYSCISQSSCLSATEVLLN